MISKMYNEQMGNYIAKLARESKPQTNADICPHYHPNHHDRGDDSLCEKYRCEVKALPRWIPAETLPPEGVDVLAIDQNGYYGIVYNSGECFADGHREWFAGDYRFEKPTHWMPLPPPPKGGEE